MGSCPDTDIDPNMVIRIRNNPQLKKSLIGKQILLVSTVGNVWSTVWRICILMLGCKG